MRITIFGIALSLLFTAEAKAVQFSYFVIFPDNEKKDYILSEKVQTIPLGAGSSYDCSVMRLSDYTDEGTTFEKATVLCNRKGASSKATFSTVVSCNSRIVSNGNLHLTTGNKEWVIFLTCK